MEVISVIVPVFNVEEYISECLDSILNQTYKQLEVILVDDGSTDRSGVICDSYAKKDSRVQVIHQKNSGVASARNAGLDRARGPYITFADSDDFIDATMYECMYQKLSESDADMIICGYKKVDEEGKPIHNDSPIINQELSVHDVLGKLNEKNGWYYLTVWNRMYKSGVWDDVRFDVGKKHEDEFVAHKLFAKCKKILTIEDKLYSYRNRQNSIMTGKANVSRLDAVEAVYTRYLFYQQKGWEDLLPGTFHMARNSMEVFKSIDKKVEGYACRRREVLRMYRYMFWQTKGNKTVKNFLIIAFPDIYFGIKRRMHK